MDEEKKRLRGHIQAVIDTEYPESENKAEPCIDHWEDSQIRRGIGIPQYRQSVEAEKTESESLSIPAPAPILTQEEEISELELSIEKMELSVSASERNLGMLRFDLERSKETLKVYTEELSVASKTYEFFQELNNYVMDLSEFIADKLAKVEKLDQLWTHTMEEEAAKTLKARQELMNLCRYFLTNPAPQDINNALSRLENSGDVVDSSFLEDLRNEREVLADERKLLLKDAKKEFRTSREMKKKLENWATGYPQLFSAAHGPDCVSSAYEFYVKYELIGYVYSDDLDIRSMKWYSELHGSHLNNSGSSTHTVTSSVTIQCVIPWFKTQLRLWDLYNCCQTKFLSRIFSQIVSIIPQASPEYTNLKNSVIDHIIQTVKVQVEKHCPHLESISRKVSDKNLFPFARFWFSRIENMQNNIMSWAPSIDRQVLEFIVEDQVTSKLQLVQEQSMFEC